MGAQRGCVDRSGPNPVARLQDGAALEFPGGTVTLTGGARTIDVEVLLPR